MIPAIGDDRCIQGRVKVRDLIRLLESDGWYLSRTRGSHRQYKHPQKPSVVTVPGAMNHDLPPGLLKHILKHAVLKVHRGGRSE